MSGQKTINSPTPAAANRRQPLLTSTSVTSPIPTSDAHFGGVRRTGSRIGETAGECAAVCCCCPCVLMHLLILAVYRLPTGLWKKKKRKRLLRKKRKYSSEVENMNQRKRNSFGFCEDYDDDEEEEEETDGEDYRGELRNDDVEWEKEMWGRFYGAGFWRSDSQRTDREMNE